MKGVMLVLTQSCNLSCVYCYENHKNIFMPWEDIRAVIDREYQDRSDFDRKVFFFGGEPFLCFEQIKRTVSYIEDAYPEFNTIYSATTNGTLIHGEIQKWLELHKNHFEIVLSIDGTKEMHDRNRFEKRTNSSFDRIDLDFFSRNWPNCVTKMTISQYTISDFSTGIIYLESLGFRCKANFASGVNLDLEENNAAFCREMGKLIDYYSENPEQPLCYMLDLNLSAIHVPLNDQFRYCSAGTCRHCYCDKETWYPCQGLMPMSTGNDMFREQDFSDTSILNESPCRKCHFVRACKVCYASNYAETGDIYAPGAQTCRINKACILASARIQYNRLKNKPKDLLTSKEKLTIMAVYRIAQEIPEM